MIPVVVLKAIALLTSVAIIWTGLWVLRECWRILRGHRDW